MAESDTNWSAIKVEVSNAHDRRGQAWLDRNAEAYLSFYWDDATIISKGKQLNTLELQAWVAPILASGGGAVSMQLPPAKSILISNRGDAATTSFAWQERFRAADGSESDESFYETDVWYKRNGFWKLICIHLTEI